MDLEKGSKLEVRASEEDVKRYIAGEIYRLPICIQRDSSLQDMVKDKIVEATDGMYALLLDFSKQHKLTDS